jgi:hypothetical protein
MPIRIGDAWGSIRGIVRENLSFAQIKDLVGEAGLAIQRLAHFQQKLGGASKGQLMDGIDGLFNEFDEDTRDRFVASCVEGLLERDADFLEDLGTTLGRVGWGVTSSGEVYPLRLQVELETSKLDGRIQQGITKTLRRYRDGDFDGAVTAICGLVDVITEKVYLQKSLGNPRAGKYQERVTKAFQALESEFKAPISSLKPDEIKKIWNNHRGAVNQAAYVLGAFRRGYSDAHGVQNAEPELVQRAIDCAVFIIRSIGSLV